MVESGLETLRIVPLGGLGQIGGNLLALETSHDMFVVDCGILFPKAGQHGVDYIVPNIDYLLSQRDKLRAIVLTHGHEDHIGALPFVLPRLNVPLFANSLTEKLIRAKLADYPHIKATIHRFSDHEPFTIGSSFEICPIPVTHSIPASVGLAIRTPIGMVVHSGDFKIDPNPSDGRHFDTEAFRRLGDEGVSLLLSDSTNAGRPGHSPSEASLREPLAELIASASGRVFVTTFASNLFRLQTVVWASEKAGRKVAAAGRRMQQNLLLSVETGYIKAQPDTIIDLDEAKRCPPQAITILASGNQGEPNSALVRMSTGRYGSMQLEPGDRVIFSSRCIPGNEVAVGDLNNALLRMGVEIYDSRQALIHASGHACQDELAALLGLCRPRYFIPVHGELSHLISHARLAHSGGMLKDAIFVTENGRPIELRREHGQLNACYTDSVAAGHSFVSAQAIDEIDTSVIRERQKLAHSGVVVCTLVVSDSGVLLAAPRIESMGLLRDELNDNLLQQAEEMIATLIHNMPADTSHSKRANEVRLNLRRFFRRSLDRKPVVLPMITIL